MPPHLHPRSTATSTLFAGTLLASFVVVGIPHLFPCPQPRRSYADAERAQQPPNSTRYDRSDGNVRERKGLSQRKAMSEEAALFAELQQEAEAMDRESRECPVPKPMGFLRKVLGFEEKESSKMIDEPSQSAAPAPAPSIPSSAVGDEQGKS
ncbi:uncharacterized protein A1O9_08511 [Exophiala aquamarina CBS 119918]|uniref:Alpha-1,3-mannosyltransferase n=1 Tax=Exophiala aquamarina CBS 119918 TaxID=1182545 RepID=A0A072PJV1_9EURO|nr:uncharacterized protein A1O9_08511 [Exophiala aquamarina CBS 119918]KEF55760.1 hypothetical protein A1O9_08511 [Exophiala aquamarina CBS 119918]